MRHKNKIILISIIIILAFGGVIFSKGILAKEKKENTQTTILNSKIAVKVQPVKIVESTSNLKYMANLEPVEEGSITSKISARVQQILFENGRYVNKGEPLVILDSEELKNQLKSIKNQLVIVETQYNGAKNQLTAVENQYKVAENQYKAAENQYRAAESSLNKAEVNLTASQQNYDRVKVLLIQGAVAQADFDKVDIALKVAKADCDAAKTNLDTLKTNIESAKVNMDSARVAIETTKINIGTAKANVDAVKINIDTINDSIADAVIKAPISGAMAEKNVMVGQMASPGGALAKVKDISSVYAVIQVEQDKVNDIKLGQKAVIELTSNPNITYEGIVKSINVAANSQARVFECKVLIENKDRTLYPGTFAMVEFISEQKHDAIIVPIQALSGSEGNYSVFVAQNGKVQKRRVSVGEISNDIAEILSGLDKGESIIITNLNILQDGDTITVSE